jgi:hypothetical protein
MRVVAWVRWRWKRWKAVSVRGIRLSRLGVVRLVVGWAGCLDLVLLATGFVIWLES